jgi:hypothetical protein
LWASPLISSASVTDRPLALKVLTRQASQGSAAWQHRPQEQPQMELFAITGNVFLVVDVRVNGIEFFAVNAAIANVGVFATKRIAYGLAGIGQFPDFALIAAVAYAHRFDGCSDDAHVILRLPLGVRNRCRGTPRQGLGCSCTYRSNGGGRRGRHCLRSGRCVPFLLRGSYRRRIRFVRFLRRLIWLAFF